MNLEIKKFNVKNLQFKATNNVDTAKGPVVIFIGRRETGKSFLMKDILYHNQSIPVGTVISGTEAANSFYGSIMPKMLVYDEYTSSIVENIMKRQKQIFKAIKHEKELHGRASMDARTFTILDDCLWDDGWVRDKMMRLLFMNGRHWNIMLLITMQYPLGIPPKLRTNVDYVFILREPYANNRKRIYENYASCFPSFDAFNQVMDQCTENYECLVIDNNTKSNNLQDMVFWYKAEAHGNFKLCSQRYWDISKEMTSDDEDGGTPYNESKLRPGKKNVPTITVKKQQW
jgi:hypothetical protein